MVMILQLNRLFTVFDTSKHQFPLRYHCNSVYVIFFIYSSSSFSSFSLFSTSIFFIFAEFLHRFFSCNYLIIYPTGHIVAYQRKHKRGATNIVTCFYRQAIPFRPEAHENQFDFQYLRLSLYLVCMQSEMSHWNGYSQRDQVGHNKV